MKIGQPKNWTEEELNLLSKLYPDTFNTVLARKFNVHIRSIQRKARSMNLVKNKDFRSSIDFSVFGAGNVAWNKGKKGLKMHEKCVQARFKKGNRSCMKDSAVVKKVTEKRNKTIEAERWRIDNGIKQKTKLKLNASISSASPGK